MFCISASQGPQASLRGATCWALLLLCGAAVQHAGWWPLYGDLGLWCGLIGGAMALAGAVGFDCGVPGHSRWWTWERPYTAEERREFNFERRQSWFNEPELPANATKLGLRGDFWFFLAGYAVFGAAATGLSAAFCPATGTVPASGNRKWDDWVPPAEAAPDAAGREYGWGDRWEADPTGKDVGCGGAAICAGLSLVFLLFLLCNTVCSELGAMRRGRRMAAHPHAQPHPACGTHVGVVGSHPQPATQAQHNAVCDTCNLPFFTASGKSTCVDCRKLPAVDQTAQTPINTAVENV